MKNKVSIIIPIYNVEKYLKQCLDSVAEQTLKDIEIICVNDGATDSSLQIIEEYSKNDNRFIVITKENGGYGESMNAGISRASGEYIGIVESDDFISDDMYENLYALAVKNENADIVKSAYYDYIDYIGIPAHSELAPFTKLIRPKNSVFTLSEYPNLLYHHPSIWSCIYRSDFLKENNIKFVEEKGAGWVDNPFFVNTLCLAKSIVWTKKAYYYYRKTNPDSSTNTLNDFKIPLNRSLEMHDVLDKYNIKDENILSIQYNRDLWNLRLIYRNCKDLNSELIEMIKQLILKTDRQKLNRAYIIDKDLENYERKALSDSGLEDDIPKKSRLKKNFSTVKDFIKIYGFGPTMIQIFRTHKTV